ncbi:radical SAM/SPASM domain-containing protein [Algoriphagus zhangzhouensis]|uniref:radical SAM/SPASM domain-containing protein n=1 Tax=Algoriphagus zhangzhouensis TaxID=1073327 RepID=UPI000936AD18|nr:radical SAM/SPASM domain-containing protein [Algoriphagus zhangzhouensis]
MNNSFQTAISYIQHLNIQKLTNLALLGLSFQLSRVVNKPILWGKPTTLSIEPTTSCNLRCPECPSGLRAFSRPTGMLDEVLFEKVIQQSKKHLTWLHLYFQGEPFLHPNFSKLVSLASKNGIFTSTSTNAHYLTENRVEEILESRLKQLIISMDGISQDVYEKYRIGGNLKKVQEGISLLVRKRKEAKKSYPRIVLQFLVTGQNEHQIPSLKSWADEIGVDELQLKTTQIYGFENGSELIPSDLKYARYIPDGNGKWKLKKEIENKCWRMWQGAVVTWDGKVVPCCFDKDAKHVMGSFEKESLDSIWKSNKYQQFRSQLLKGRDQIDICKNCTE